MPKFKLPFFDFNKKVSETVTDQDIIEEMNQPEEKALSLDNKCDNIYSVARICADTSRGLSQDEVNLRVTQNLTNKLENKYSKSYGSIFASNIFTFFNLLCIICLGFLIYAKSSISNMFFIVVFALNSGIAIFQEIKAKKSIEKLSLMTVSPTKVIRSGISVDVAKENLVLDDVISLSTGDQIPCDCSVIEGYIEVNESALSGESTSVKKNPSDFLYAGSFISSGTCYARIEKIGKDSYIQKLTAKAKKYKKPSSTLMSSLKFILSTISIMIVPITILMFLSNFAQTQNLNVAIIKTSTVTIGLIPCGMFLLTTVAMAVGVIRLAKKNTLVQDLYSLEMLARIDVLCLDKTGTITDGRMTVKECIPYRNSQFNIDEIISSMLFATKDNNQTAVALQNRFGQKQQLFADKILPFSSKRKYSAVTFKELGTFVLGAPEFILSNFPDDLKTSILENAKQGYRVLLLAFSTNSIHNGKIPSQLKPVSLIVVEDTIREDSIPTIKWFKNNDVAVKIISGDNPATVAEIAKRVGVDNADKYVSLEGFSTQEIINVANEYTVFGRVTPEQKAILVKAMKAHGHTVAMMGDGVNDILAMKESDCSVTVATGSQAAKNVSNIILTDNNFSHMSCVVEEGRRVVNNVESSSSLYLMKTLFTAIFAIITIISKTAYPFELKMMIFLELFIIGVPSFFLSLQANNKRIQGNFLGVVFSNALPGALVLVINVYLMQFACKLIGLQDAVNAQSWERISNTLTVISLTTGGLAYLYKLCSPLNWYRRILFGATFIIFMVWAIWLKQTPIFGMVSLFPFSENWPYILLLFSIFQLDFPMTKLFLKFSDWLKTLNP